jgi:hypothetical protein
MRRSLARHRLRAWWCRTTRLGACTGDSRAPVFRDVGGKLMVPGVVSWSTGPNNSDGCGGLTGVLSGPHSLFAAKVATTPLAGKTDRVFGF